MTTPRIFIAGGTGVLGRRTVTRLVEAGHAVTVIARSPQKAEAVRDAGASPATVDLFDPAALTRAVEGHDVVANLATHIPPTSKAALPGAWSQNDRIRREGARNLVDAALAAGAGRYLQESVGFVYADGGDAWLDEDAPLDVAPYLASNLDALAATERFRDGGGVGIFLRFGMFYAPDAHQLADQIRLARRGQAMEVGALDGYRSMVHADDAATAVVAALSAPSGIYNVAEDEPATRREHLDLTARLVGRSSLHRAFHHLRWVGGKKVEVLARSHRLSSQRFREATGWRPQYPSIHEGFPPVFAALGAHPVATS